MTAGASGLSAEDASFIEGGVSIHAATRDATNQTTVARAVGCRVSADRRQVTIFLSAVQAATLLANVRANGVIAVVFSQPSSHRTIQLKGTDATVAPSTPEDPHLWSAYRARLASEVRPLGFSDGFARALLSTASGDMVAVAFTPSAAFVQTPGSKAGAPLPARA
jgi:hypothetical protein